MSTSKQYTFTTHDIIVVSADGEGEDTLDIQLEVTIDSVDGEDYDYEIEGAFISGTDQEFDLKKLSAKDASRLDDELLEFAGQHASEAYMDRLAYQTDLLYDRWKDGDI